MPLLLEDLAAETTISNRRLADRLDAETLELEQVRQVLAAVEEQRHRVVASARQATEHVLSRVPQTEGVWRSALAALRNQPTKDSAERLLRSLLSVFESGQKLVHAPRAMWKLAEQIGAAPERLDELSRAENRFEELVAEVKIALEHQASGWQPADPDRLASGLRLASEGKTVNAAEALARFRSRCLR